MAITVSVSDLQALLPTAAITAEQYAAVRKMTVNAINADLPQHLGLASCEDCTSATNVAIIDTVFTIVAIRALSNPAGAQQVSVEGTMTGYQSDGIGASPFTLRRNERAKMARLEPETAQSSHVSRITTSDLDDRW